MQSQTSSSSVSVTHEFLFTESYAGFHTACKAGNTPKVGDSSFVGMTTVELLKTAPDVYAMYRLMLKKATPVSRRMNNIIKSSNTIIQAIDRTGRVNKSDIAYVTVALKAFKDYVYANHKSVMSIDEFYALIDQNYDDEVALEMVDIMAHLADSNTSLKQSIRYDCLGYISPTLGLVVDPEETLIGIAFAAKRSLKRKAYEAMGDMDCDDMDCDD